MACKFSSLTANSLWPQLQIPGIRRFAKPGGTSRTIRADNKAREGFYLSFRHYLSETTVLQPDLSFFAADVLSRISKRGAEGPPTLAIEILSPTIATFDQTSMKDLYARFGVKEMWIVDTDKSSIQVHALDGDGRMVVLGVGDQLTSNVLPGFQALVEEVFA